MLLPPRAPHLTLYLQVPLCCSAAPSLLSSERSPNALSSSEATRLYLHSPSRKLLFSHPIHCYIRVSHPTTPLRPSPFFLPYPFPWFNCRLYPTCALHALFTPGPIHTRPYPHHRVAHYPSLARTHARLFLTLGGIITTYHLLPTYHLPPTYYLPLGYYLPPTHCLLLTTGYLLLTTHYLLGCCIREGLPL